MLSIQITRVRVNGISSCFSVLQDLCNIEGHYIYSENSDKYTGLVTIHGIIWRKIFISCAQQGEIKIRENGNAAHLN